MLTRRSEYPARHLEDVSFKMHIWSFILALKSVLTRFAVRFRKPVLTLAFLFFAFGIGYSASSLEVQLADVRLLPLLAVGLVLTPCTLAYSAVNMVVMARAAKVHLSLLGGVKVSAYAQVAELLPIPGGAIVRGAALNRAGAGIGKSTRLVISFSLLWIACASVLAGVAFWEEGWALQVFALGSALGTIAIFIAIATEFGFAVALSAISLRIVGLALVAIRLWLVFMALHQAMDFQAAALFSFTSVAGSAASLVPGGLGISESLSALLSGTVGIPAPVAFLALGINRIIGLTVHLSFALLFAWRERRPSSNPEIEP